MYRSPRRLFQGGGVIELLKDLHDQDLIADIDWHFARAIARFDGHEHPEVALAAALASVQTRRGHVCLDLADCAAGSLSAVLEDASLGDRQIPDYMLPELEEWQHSLLSSPVVAGPDCERQAPLVLDDAGRLYLARYRRAETDVAVRLIEMARARERLSGVDGKLGRLFGEGDDDQRRAAEAVLSRRLCVVTGGPGTGKTFVAARVIALLLDSGLARLDRIALVAPTGKAAARLQESVSVQVKSLAATVAALADYRAKASTVHRLLYQARDGGLPVDAVILDEASMVDLALMSRLLDALPDAGRLVVLGDADQLASVQPGAVLGDLCAAAAVPGSPLDGCVLALTKSRRFAKDSGIGRLADAIVSGDVAGALDALNDPRDSRTELHPMGDTRAFDRFAASHAVESWAPCLENPHEVPFPKLRVLCAHRHGPFGTYRFNRLVEAELRRRGLVGREEFYPGRPIIVTRNDRATALSNGDTGIVVDGGDGRRVWFPDLKRSDGERFEVSPARLPAHDSFFALTVHRAQGSEYDEVAFVPGPAESRVVTRELFYTAVTRAREKVVVHGTEDGVMEAVVRSTDRVGGLASRLAP
ncbi:MAG: exodeoxyribonuclease V subunit alpha [Gammaproteobacteria bacterium]|nr:exodeoxyribonuclease V subunit alpha [Gammaproteobacteria bacterium]MYK45253.1 exodeoxyribonuclease V subunit alpha [Gammaproteobacteria bacterium]